MIASAFQSHRNMQKLLEFSFCMSFPSVTGGFFLVYGTLKNWKKVIKGLRHKKRLNLLLKTFVKRTNLKYSIKLGQNDQLNGQSLDKNNRKIVCQAEKCLIKMIFRR